MTVRCPKTGEPIPLDKFSISKWSDQLYLVYCPTCRVMHEFTPVAADGEERSEEK